MKPVDVRDGICAYLMGGLGNQLFILAAAWQQSVRLGCPLYVDTSRYLAADPIEFAKETQWDFGLDNLNLPGTVIGVESPWYRNSPRRPRLLRQPGRGGARLAVHRERTFGFDSSIDEIQIGTTILGYFQSPKYFNQISPLIQDLIEAGPLTGPEERLLTNLSQEPRVTLHVRRGDYLNPIAAAHHGIASGQYFERALGLIEQLRPGRRPRIFSDSLALAREELPHASSDDFFEQPQSVGGIATIRAMSLGQGFIMSNSSFSWWAAWLMQRRTDEPVIAPRPWTRSGESASDLLLPDWITLDAR